MNFENMTEEHINKMSPAMKLRLAYLKLQKEKAEKENPSTVELKDGEVDKGSSIELIKLAYEKMLKQEERDSLSD